MASGDIWEASLEASLGGIWETWGPQGLPGGPEPCQLIKVMPLSNGMARVLLKCQFYDVFLKVTSTLMGNLQQLLLAGARPDPCIARGPSFQDRENPYSKDCLGNDFPKEIYTFSPL